VTRETTGRLAEIGLAIRDAVNSQHQVCHPVLSHLNKVELVTFLGPASRRDARYLNTHMFGKGSIDRSPGGTATSAMLAVLHAKGEIMVGDVVTAEGVAGGFFRGRVVERTRVGDRDAVVPEVTGPAAVTGLHHFVVDSDDALSAGFELA
jgi:proline racemase